MSLTPDGKLGLALVTGTMVVGIYSLQMPGLTDVRTVESGNSDVASQERAATWMAATAVAAISLMSKSPETFTVGGLFVVGMAWSYRHADQVSPITKKATGVLTADSLARAQMPEAAPATASAPAYATVI